MFKVIVYLSASLSVTAIANAATLTVDLKGGADYIDIQSAIDAAADGDTVLVKPGEYVVAEPITFKGKKIAVRGEAGAEATTIRLTEAPANPVRASVMAFESGETAASVLEGFTITGGKGTKYGAESWEVGGGGIFCTNGSSPTITNCTISGNSAWYGGGVYLDWDSSPILTSCTISGNSTTQSGGGVFCRISSPTLTGCTISGNSALGALWGEGGGVSCGGQPSPILTNCTISENRAFSGGGVYCWDNSSPTLTNCVIAGNSAFGGGGVFCSSSSPTLTGCTISENQAFGGGGVFCAGGSPTLTSCTISGNSAGEGRGGGVFCWDSSSPTLTNCTISGNFDASGEGGGVLCDELSLSSPTLTNCIVWGNTPESVCGSISACLADRDPLFVRPGEWIDCTAPDDPACIAYKWSADTGEPTAWHRWGSNDYHLRPGSPAIDAGISEGAPTTDIEGHGRPCGAGLDIGAYEFGDCQGPTERFRRGDADSSGTLDLTDPMVLLGHLFLGGDPPKCRDAADVDDSGTLDITDAIYSLNFLFLGGKALPEPFPDCEIDPTFDDLDCSQFSHCE